MLNPCSNEAAEELEGDLEDNLLGDSDAAGVSDAVDAVQDADIVQQHGQNAAYILQPCENPRFSTWAAVAEPLPMSQPCYLAIQPHHQLGPPIVGGLQISLSDESQMQRPGSSKKGAGERILVFNKQGPAPGV